MSSSLFYMLNLRSKFVYKLGQTLYYRNFVEISYNITKFITCMCLTPINKIVVSDENVDKSAVKG